MVAALVVLAGCGGDGTEPLVPTELAKFAGDQQAGNPGETLPEPLEVQVTDQNGSPLSGVTVEFEPSSGSVDPGSATTGDDGRASTIYTLPPTEGTLTVAATASGLGPVEFTLFAVAADCPAVSQLEPGESVLLNPLARDCDVVLPTGSVGDRYRLGVVRAGASTNDSDTTFVQVVVSGDAVAAPRAVPEAAAAPAFLELPGGMLQDLANDSERSRVHLRHLRESVALALRLGPSAWEGAVRRAGETRAEGVERAAAPDRRILDASDECSTEDERVAHLLGENDYLAIYQDSIQRQELPVSATSVQRMLDYYEVYGHQVTEQYFGGTPDINGDGQIVVFVTPAVSSEFAAFVWSGDFFDESNCAASNEMEIIYFAADNIRRMEETEGQSFQALSTLVHEAKHVSSLFNRLAATNRIGSDQFHPSWVEEGTAEIAAEVSSRLAWADSGGPAVTARVTRQHFETSKFNSANWGVALRLARLVWYLSSQPNAITVTPVGAAQNHNIRGGSWHLHRWIGDAYVGAGDQALGDAGFFREQNDSLAEPGHRGIEALLGKSFPDLLGEYTEAVALHGTGAPALRRPFALYDFTTAAEIFRDPDPQGIFPWPVTTHGVDENPSVSFAPATHGAPMGPSGVQVYDFESTGTGTRAEIDVRMGGPALVVVTRLP